MIAPLRARHRAMIAALAIALPLGFAAAIGGRDDERPAAALPDALASDGPELGALRAKHSVLHDGRGYSVRLGEGVVGVVQEAGERAPDVVAYWCSAAPVDGELPADAVLLGTLGERERRFRAPAASARGHVVLFSLAHGEIVADLEVD